MPNQPILSFSMNSTEKICTWTLAWMSHFSWINRKSNPDFGIIIPSWILSISKMSYATDFHHGMYTVHWFDILAHQCILVFHYRLCLLTKYRYIHTYKAWSIFSICIISLMTLTFHDVIGSLNCTELAKHVKLSQNQFNEFPNNSNIQLPLNQLSRYRNISFENSVVLINYCLWTRAYNNPWEVARMYEQLCWCKGLSVSMWQFVLIWTSVS